MRYDRPRAELEALVAARWGNLRKAAQADDIKVMVDDVLESLENKYPTS